MAPGARRLPRASPRPGATSSGCAATRPLPGPRDRQPRPAPQAADRQRLPRQGQRGGHRASFQLRRSPARPAAACAAHVPRRSSVKVAGAVHRRHRRGSSVARRAGVLVSRTSSRSLDRAAAARSRTPRPQGDPGPARVPARQCRPRLPHARPRQSGTLSGGESQRIRLASQIGSRPVRACSTSSTSPPSASTSATTTGCSAPCAACSGLGNYGHRRRARRGRHPPRPTTSSIVGPGAGIRKAAHRSSPRAPLAEVLASPASLTGRYLSGARRSECPPRGSGARATRPSRHHRSTRRARPTTCKDVDGAPSPSAS